MAITMLNDLIPYDKQYREGYVDYMRDTLDVFGAKSRNTFVLKDNSEHFLRISVLRLAEILLLQAHRNPEKLNAHSTPRSVRLISSTCYHGRRRLSILRIKCVKVM